jgi:hypothetical protein
MPGIGGKGQECGRTTHFVTAQKTNFRANSPTLISSGQLIHTPSPGLALLCCRWQGQEGGDENIFLTEAITGQTKGRSLLSHIHFFRAGLPKIPKSRASFYSASWSMCGITLLSTAAGRSPDLIPQEQFSQDSQVKNCRGQFCIALRNQHVPKQQPRCRTSAWPLVITDPCS